MKKESEPKEKAKQVRQPKQSRSMDKKEKIIDAALILFCEKGYFNTTTNEIAQKAQVSIGSLYSYFKDKDTVFFAVLDKYHEQFFDAKSGAMDHPEMIRTDIKAWLRLLIDGLIRVHEESKEFNREINVLAYYNPRVNEILSQNRAETLREVTEYFINYQGELKIDDLEATVIVVYDLISATVHRIVFGENEIDRERLIQSTIDIIERYWKVE